MEQISFLLTRNVKAPNRAHSDDAGIDFYVPKFTKSFLQAVNEKNPTLINNFGNVEHFYDHKENKFYYKLGPHERINIPSGVKTLMTGNNKALIAFNKSGMSTKHGLVAGACVVDISYQGEIHLNVINTSNETVFIYEDMKILQFIEVPIYTSSIKIINALGDNIDEATDKFYENHISERKDKGFDSTQNK